MLYFLREFGYRWMIHQILKEVRLEERVQPLETKKTVTNGP